MNLNIQSSFRIIDNNSRSNSQRKDLANEALPPYPPCAWQRCLHDAPRWYCSFSSPTPVHAAAQGKDTLVFVNYRDLRDLNPHLYAGEMFAQEMVFEGLVTLGNDGKYHGAVAESWDISPDGRVYTFKIRPNLKFTDGHVLDAYAVKANFDALIDNKTRHSWLEMMRLLEGVEAPDANTFVIKMKEAYYPMLTELAVTRPFAFVSPNVMKDGKTKNGLTAFIGSGPYVLKEHVVDEYSVFEANPDYWGKKPAIKRIVVKVIPDNQTRILALEKGEIDLIWGKNMIDADALNKYRDSKKFSIAVSSPTSTRQIVLNTTNDIHQGQEDPARPFSMRRTSR